MTITTTHLTRAAGLSAVAAGLLFIGVQINHPPLDLALATTTEFGIRQGMKVAMSVLSLIGITGMYLSQVPRTGRLGMVGYLTFAAGYLAMLTVEVVGLVVFPAIAHSSPGYVSDVFAVATGGTASGDLGLMQPLTLLMGVGYMAGGLLFGIALFRANVLARWATLLLAGATALTAASALLPWIDQRLFAVPTGVAMVALGYSLWRGQRIQSAAASQARPLAEPAVAR
ncbi:MAG TPA: hypothetical protein VLQ67_07795 [Arachnia sp.]|nr:hypothetical protein [Arachnia sp.]